MILGTDLSEAYEFAPSPSPQQQSPPPQIMVAPPQSQQPNVRINQTQQQSQPKQTDPLYNAEAINQQYNMEQAILRQAYAMANAKQQQSQPAAKATVETYNNEGGYLDMLGSKKKDMLKLIIIAVMILLAMSIHSFVTFWLKEYIVSSELSFRQELGVRLLYPVLVLFVLWNLKAAK
jgi:hypothetical protein